MSSEVAKKVDILLVGPESAGKTALITAYKNENFCPTYKATMGIDHI